MNDYKWNPKVKGSGIITCIPQTGICPNKCEDCFFQSGRSYLEPLNENLPHLPPPELIEGRIVRINDGNDSNVDRDLVEGTAEHFPMHFFNTSIPEDLGKFDAPVVLTVNPGKTTDKRWYKLPEIPDNLMFVRIRANMWNRISTAGIIDYYSSRGVAVVLTFMAYYKNDIPEEYKPYYSWKKRTLNSYWVLGQDGVKEILGPLEDNPFVYTCGVKGRFECMFCGNCVREYHNAMERMRGVSKRIKT